MLKNKNNHGQAWIVFGPQGSGKSTQAEKLAEHLKCPLFEAGQQIRQLIESGSPAGQRAHEATTNGQLIPNDILKQLIVDFLTTVDVRHCVVFDGFPRNMDQCQVLHDLAEKYHWQVTGLLIEISDETAKERLANRFTMVDGQKVFREDDTPEVVAKRLATFKRETLPIVTWLETHYQVITIDGQPPISEVTANIFTKVQEISHD